MQTNPFLIIQQVVLAAFLFLFVPVFGQRNDLRFHHVGQKEGLSELTNEYIYQDLEGFIWIGSISGLNRFDGASVKKYLWNQRDSTSVYGENIQSSFFEPDSTGFWFCTFEAINFYDRSSDQFKHYFVYDSIGIAKKGYHAFHLDPNGKLWVIVDEQSIILFDIHTKAITKIATLAQYAQRAVAVTDSSSQVLKVFAYKMNTLGVQEINFQNGVQTDSIQILLQHHNGKPFRARKILLQNDNTFWYVTQAELIKYNYNTRKMVMVNIPDILAIADWKDDKLLVSIAKEGIRIFDKADMNFLEGFKHDVTDSYSVRSNTINYISSVKNEGYWFCSNGVGCSFTYPAKRKFDKINPFPAERRKEFSPYVLFPYNERIYTSVIGDGLYALDENGESVIKIGGINANANERMESITGMFTDSQNNLWITGFLGNCILSSTGNVVETFADDFYWCGIKLSDGRILLARRNGGLDEVDISARDESFMNIRPDIYNKPYYPIYQDHQDRLWLSADASNILVVDPVTYDVIADLPINGYISGFIDMAKYNSIWIGSSTGLYKIDARKLTIEKIYNETTGFPSTNMSGIVSDDKDRIWIASQSNIILFDPYKESTRIYVTEDGLPASVFNVGSNLVFPDGKIWFGSPDGIISFYPDQVTEITTPAIPQITTLHVNDQEPAFLQCLSTQSTNITEIKRLSFPYKENTLGFIVNALEYSAPSANKVMYKMESLDRDWVTTTNGALVRYPNIPPGKYIFYVKAFNSDGIANEKLRILEISIIPPYYKTWWFYTLLVLAGLGLLSLFLYLRISKALEIQKVRLRLYENLHDDVGSRLTSIVMSADMMLKEEKSNPKLQQMVATGRSIVGNMKRLVWAIDPVNESMESLILKIRDDRNMTLDPAVQFQLESDPALQQKVIPGEIRYQLMSIISEAFHNITKYAQAKNVWVQFSKKDKHLVMTIRDDGIGFDPSKVTNDKVKTSGYGLGNMHKRMKRVNGALDISSGPGHGTTITVTIPLR